MGGIGRAYGKLMLFGEHSAVYGHPAVGTSLPEALTARLYGRLTEEWDLGTVAAEDREPVRGVLTRLEGIVPGLAAAGRCSLSVESTVPRGTGFGSSAALCGALALAAMEHAGAPRSASARRDAWRHAHDAERLFHGTPSGVDTGLSLIGGTLAFRPRPPALPSVESLPRARLWLVTGAVPRDEACGALIAALGARMRAGETTVRDAMGALGSIAQDAWGVLRAATGAAQMPVAIGALADRAMGTLAALGLSTPALDALIQAGRSAGAAGGKLSGAGGGGAFFLVAVDEAGARAVAAAVAAAAAREGIPLTAPARVLPLS